MWGSAVAERVESSDLGIWVGETCIEIILISGFVVYLNGLVFFYHIVESLY